MPPTHFDSPVIYGARVETLNPYHLVYIEKLYINVINREKGESSKVKDEGEVIYERPSEEQLRRARELYKQV